MAIFGPAIEYLLANEGGYVNNPHDPGGETAFGITQKDLPGRSVKDLTKADAIAWYEANYWSKAPWADIQNQQVCTKLFDSAMNIGVRAAILLVQHVLCFRDEEVDGSFGPKTLTGINNDQPLIFLSDFVEVLILHYKVIEQRHPELTIFDKGWMIRAKKLPPVV